MKKSKGYEIPYPSLALGSHEFNFNISDSFFEQFAEPSFQNANLEVQLILDKKTTLFLLDFKITGSITTLCDRCGDDFDMQIWDEFQLTAKLTSPELVEKLNDEDDEVVYFDKTENSIDITYLLYEQIILSLPMQRIHPDDENGKSGCNTEAIQLLQQLEDNVEVNPKKNKTKENKTEEIINPFSLQEQLKKLKK
jgi:uncharacterized metal-binding protein YceD (DUF177 family)